jgi:putative membrane protein
MSRRSCHAGEGRHPAALLGHAGEGRHPRAAKTLDSGLRRNDGAALALCLLCPLTARAHDVGRTAFEPWSFEPWVVACLAISALLYALGLRRLWRRAGAARGIGGWHAAAFGAGWLTLAAALLSPLDALGAQLFSAHMVQHELLMVVAAPLLVLGRPLAAWTWALPMTARRSVGAWTRHPLWARPWHAITAPLGAWLLHALALWAWHVPALFDAALANEAVHALQHASFLVGALLFWWSVLGARRAYAAGLLSLFTTLLHTAALGALLALAASPWYAAYLGRTSAFGLSPLEDQQLGGMVMWMPAGFGYLAAALVLMARLLARQARAAPHPALPAVRRYGPS